MIINAVKESDKLEVYNDFKVRTKTEPTKWPLGRDDPQPEPAHLGNSIAANLVTAEPASVVVPLSNTLTNIPPPPVLRNSRRANANAAPAAAIASGDTEKPAKTDTIEASKVAGVEKVPNPAADKNGNVVIPTSKQTDDSNIWTEVKRRSKPTRDSASHQLFPDEDGKKRDKEELDFQFDEEIDPEHVGAQSGGRANNFSEFSDDDEESDYELSDRDIHKLLIVTQVKTRLPKHEGEFYGVSENLLQLSIETAPPTGYDRTADWTTRVKISQDLEQVIDDGLRNYEEDLLVKPPVPHKTVNVITQAEFNQLLPKVPKRVNPEVPPAPPATFDEKELSKRLQLSHGKKTKFFAVNKTGEMFITNVKKLILDLFNYYRSN